MVQKYECVINTVKGGYEYAECKAGDEDWYIFEPDFEGGFNIARQFGPNDTEEETDRNTHKVVIEERYIVDKFKDFLNSTEKKMITEYNVRKGFDVTYMFEKESHGWLRCVQTMKMDGDEAVQDILVHKDVVPYMKKIIDHVPMYT